jgi:hypothetical protein
MGPAMAEHSHREEMNAAIRAQRERQAVPRTIAPEPVPAHEPEPMPEPKAAEAAVEAPPERKRRLGFFRRK